MRIGRIVAVEDFRQARRPAWKLRIDFGPELGEKRSSAQITNCRKTALLLFPWVGKTAIEGRTPRRA